MSEFDPMAATATAEDAAAPSQGAEVEGQGTQAGDASGGDTPAQPQAIPYQRFNEVLTERNDLRAKYEAFSPFEPIIQTAQRLGLTPEQFAQRVFAQQQAAEAAQPQGDPFREFLEAREIDPEYLTPGQLRAYQEDFDLRQQMQQFAAQQQQQQQAQVVQYWESQMGAVQQQYPVFKDNPELSDVLAAATFAQDPTGRMLPQVAAAMNTAIERAKATTVAQYAAGKQQDATVPVVSGGSAPAPTAPQVDYHSLTADQRESRMESYLGTLHRTP